MDLGRILGCTTCCVKATPKQRAAAEPEPDERQIEQGQLFPVPPAEESLPTPLESISTSARPPQLASRQGFFMVKVDKTKAETWALDLNFGRLKRLSVLKVREGPVTRWNEANPDKMIESGDWIEKVNETKNVPQAMVQALLTADKLELLVRKSWYTGQIYPEMDDETVASENLSHHPLPPDQAEQTITTGQNAPEQGFASLSNSKQAHSSKKTSASAQSKLERIESADSVSTCPGASESSASIVVHRSLQSPESTPGSCQEMQGHQTILPSDVPPLLETQSEEEVARQIADACCEDLFSEDRSEYSQTWENLAKEDAEEEMSSEDTSAYMSTRPSLAMVPETDGNSELNTETSHTTQAQSKPKAHASEELLSTSSSVCLSEKQSLATVPETASNTEDLIETASNSEDHIETPCSIQPESLPLAPAAQELSSDSSSCLTTGQRLAAVPETASSTEGDIEMLHNNSCNSEPTAPSDQELLLPEQSSSCSTAREIPNVPETVSNSEASELTTAADEEHAELFPCAMPNRRALDRRRSFERPQRMQTEIGRRLSDNSAQCVPNAALEQRMRDCLDKVTDLERLSAAQTDWDPPEEFKSAVLKLSRELEDVGRVALEDGCSRSVPGAMEIFEEHNHALDRLAVVLEPKLPALVPAQKSRTNIGIAYGIGLLACLLGCATGFIR